MSRDGHVAAASDGAVLSGLSIAVVEDDAELAAMIVDELRIAGAQAVALSSAEALYRRLLSQSFDLVVLDIGLPGEDGYSVAGYLRRVAPQTGIVMLTGRGGVGDMARGLREGADLFLVKPLDMDVLAAAVASVRRRLPAMAGTRAASAALASAASGPAPALPAGTDWRLSEDGWTLHAPGGHTLALSEAERGLLLQLFAHRGAPVSRETLIAGIAGAPWAFDPHRLEVMVHRLRVRVRTACQHALPVRAVRGRGYLLADPE